MAQFGKCNNYNNCDIADARESVEIDDSEDFVCPECKKKLQKGGGTGKKPNFMPMIIGGLVLLLVILGASFAFLGSGDGSKEENTTDSTTNEVVEPTPEKPDNPISPTDTLDTGISEVVEETPSEIPEKEEEPVKEPESEVVKDEPKVEFSESKLLKATINLPQKLEMLRDLEKGEISASERNELYQDLQLIAQFTHRLGTDATDVLATVLEMEMELRRLSLKRERNVAVKIIQKLK